MYDSFLRKEKAKMANERAHKAGATLSPVINICMFNAMSGKYLNSQHLSFVNKQLLIKPSNIQPNKPKFVINNDKSLSIMTKC